MYTFGSNAVIDAVVFTADARLKGPTYCWYSISGDGEIDGVRIPVDSRLKGEYIGGYPLTGDGQRYTIISVAIPTDAQLSKNISSSLNADSQLYLVKSSIFTSDGYLISSQFRETTIIKTSSSGKIKQ